MHEDMTLLVNNIEFVTLSISDQQFAQGNGGARSYFKP
jgi:hypothetical protein